MNRITVNFKESRGKINRNLYGHFSEHIGGVFTTALGRRGQRDRERTRLSQSASWTALRSSTRRCCAGRADASRKTYDWRDGVGRARSVRGA